MPSYDTEKFDPPPDPELVCCICHCVLFQPVESPCRHVFCKECVETWLKDHLSCPTCRRKLTKQELKPVLPLIQNMINRLSIRCDNYNNGCKNPLHLEDYEAHVKECGYTMVKCKYSRCQKQMLLKELKDHENYDCDWREVRCQDDCELLVPINELRYHNCIVALKKCLKERTEELAKVKMNTMELLKKMERTMHEQQNLTRQLEEANRRLAEMSDSDTDSWTLSDDSSNFEFTPVDTSDDERTQSPFRGSPVSSTQVDAVNTDSSINVSSMFVDSGRDGNENIFSDTAQSPTQLVMLSDDEYSQTGNSANATTTNPSTASASSSGYMSNPSGATREHTSSSSDSNTSADVDVTDVSIDNDSGSGDQGSQQSGPISGSSISDSSFTSSSHSSSSSADSDGSADIDVTTLSTDDSRHSSERNVVDLNTSSDSSDSDSGTLRSHSITSPDSVDTKGTSVSTSRSDSSSDTDENQTPNVSSMNSSDTSGTTEEQPKISENIDSYHNISNDSPIASPQSAVKDDEGVSDSSIVKTSTKKSNNKSKRPGAGIYSSDSDASDHGTMTENNTKKDSPRTILPLRIRGDQVSSSGSDTDNGSRGDDESSDSGSSQSSTAAEVQAKRRRVVKKKSRNRGAGDAPLNASDHDSDLELAEEVLELRRPVLKKNNRKRKADSDSEVQVTEGSTNVVKPPRAKHQKIESSKTRDGDARLPKKSQFKKTNMKNSVNNGYQVNKQNLKPSRNSKKKDNQIVGYSGHKSNIKLNINVALDVNVKAKEMSRKRHFGASTSQVNEGASTSKQTSNYENSETTKVMNSDESEHPKRANKTKMNGPQKSTPNTPLPNQKGRKSETDRPTPVPSESTPKPGTSRQLRGTGIGSQKNKAKNANTVSKQSQNLQKRSASRQDSNEPSMPTSNSPQQNARSNRKKRLRIPVSYTHSLITDDLESDESDVSWQRDDTHTSSDEDSLSAYSEPDSSYEVKVPKRAAELLAEYGSKSDDSDGSWKP